MVCKRVETCKLRLSLEDFTNICATTDVERPGCPDAFTHRRIPVGWKHYIKITYNELHGTKY